jgi:hypothetical protein
MLRLLMTTLLSLPLVTYADHHAMPENVVVEIYECMLNEGSGLQDVIAYARSDFNAWAEAEDINARTFIWEPVAITPPYHEAELRWINYFPTWADYHKANKAWTKPENAKNPKAIAAMTTCEKPVFATSKPVTAMPSGAPQKPLIVGVCQLNEGATMNDATTYLSDARMQAMNKALGLNNGMMLWAPGFGLNPEFDFLQIIAGTDTDMMGLFDAVRTGAARKAQMAFNDQPAPMSCHWDLSTSHQVRI